VVGDEGEGGVLLHAAELDREHAAGAGLRTIFVTGELAVHDLEFLIRHIAQRVDAAFDLDQDRFDCKVHAQVQLSQELFGDFQAFGGAGVHLQDAAAIFQAIQPCLVDFILVDFILVDFILVDFILADDRAGYRARGGIDFLVLATGLVATTAIPAAAACSTLLSRLTRGPAAFRLRQR